MVLPTPGHGAQAVEVGGARGIGRENRRDMIKALPQGLALTLWAEAMTANVDTAFAAATTRTDAHGEAAMGTREELTKRLILPLLWMQLYKWRDVLERDTTGGCRLRASGDLGSRTGEEEWKGVIGMRARKALSVHAGMLQTGGHTKH